MFCNFASVTYLQKECSTLIRNDIFLGESIYRCIVKMKPRRVVIVRGSREDNKALSDACASIVDASSSDAGNTDNDGSQNKRVFTPRTGEVVDATTETHIYQVHYLCHVLLF